MVRLEENVIHGDYLGSLLEDALISRATPRSIDSYEKDLNIELSGPKKKTFESFDDWIMSKQDVYWIAITGSWRTIDDTIIEDLNKVVNFPLDLGTHYGIMNGDAIGVDFVSNEIALHSLKYSEESPGKYLSLVLPTPRGLYMERLSKVAMEEDEFIRTQAVSLIKQLQYIEKNWPEAIFDDYADGHINEEMFLDSNELKYRTSVYHGRNGLIAYGCDASIGLRVNGSKGVEDNQEKVRLLQKPTLTQNYKIDISKSITDYETLKIPGIKERSYETSI